LEFFVFNFQKFMLVFARLMGLILTAPFFSSTSNPARVKLALSFVVSAVVFPMVYEFLPQVPDNLVFYGMMAAGEGLIGAAMGFLIRLAFSVYQLAGQFFTVQMGFGASEVFDPMSQISLPLMGQFLYLVAVMVFITMSGPLFVIKEIYASFELVTFDKFMLGPFIESEYGLISMFVKMFLVALRIAIPIIGTLLLVSITMGLLAKAAPQMNLLMIGFPISITVAFIILVIVLPGMVTFFGDLMYSLFEDIWKLMLEVSDA
jgi:flagellar biosynthetic protein FliR